MMLWRKWPENQRRLQTLLYEVILSLWCKCCRYFIISKLLIVFSSDSRTNTVFLHMKNTATLSSRWSWIWPRRGTIYPVSSPRKSAGTWAAQTTALRRWEWITVDPRCRGWARRRSSICLWSLQTPRPNSADTDKNCEFVMKTKHYGSKKFQEN